MKSNLFLEKFLWLMTLGYVFQNGACVKITLKSGECFQVTKNFFQSSKECDKGEFFTFFLLN
jgi:hypothetical protein